jgi:hypothetical protein
MIPDLARDDPGEVLRRVFGFPGFRGLQGDVVRHVGGGGDALVLMPTGGGKSLCYQIPAIIRAGTAVVISPLIALMDDQVAALRQAGVAAGALHSELDPAEARAVSRDLMEGRLDLLYLSPERLLGNDTLERLSRVQLALFAIDEAHCVSQWGHEFRPEYRGLVCLPRRFPGVPRIALTATADPRTRKLSSPQSPPRGAAQDRRDGPVAAGNEPASRLVRHRLLRQPGEDGAGCAEARGEGLAGGRLPCGSGGGGEAGCARAVPFRRAGGGRRDDCLRHGDRSP